MITKNLRSVFVAGLATAMGVIASIGCDRSHNKAPVALDGFPTGSGHLAFEVHKAKVKGLGDIWSYEFNLPTQYLVYAMGSEGSLWVSAYPINAKATLLKLVSGDVVHGFVPFFGTVTSMAINSRGPVTLEVGKGQNNSTSYCIIQYDQKGKLLWQQQLNGQAIRMFPQLVTTDAGEVLASAMDNNELIRVTQDGQLSHVIGESGSIQGLHASSDRLFASVGSGFYRVENGVLKDRISGGSSLYPKAIVQIGEDGKPYIWQEARGLKPLVAIPEQPIVPDKFMFGFYVGTSSRDVVLKDTDNGLLVYKDGRRTRFESSKDLPLWKYAEIVEGRNGWLRLAQSGDDHGDLSGTKKVILVHFRP